MVISLHASVILMIDFCPTFLSSASNIEELCDSNKVRADFDLLSLLSLRSVASVYKIYKVKWNCTSFSIPNIAVATGYFDIRFPKSMNIGPSVSLIFY